MRKSKLREYQDKMENAGWRIKTIPYDDPSKPMIIPPNWYALAGLAVLVGGIWLFLRHKQLVYAWVALGGFAFICISLLCNALTRRRRWVTVQARCLDMETAQAGRREWHFRILCRFELDGKNYTVTPKHFWRSFGSNEDLRSFFSKVIGPDGTCFLHVNPKNPLETELIADDVADKLFRRSASNNSASRGS
ncbi:MAG: hypothetical protein ACK4UN_20970 [Limisphaerales bacterium]